VRNEECALSHSSLCIIARAVRGTPSLMINVILHSIVNQDADGGRRFDEYVHTDEFPNPLETAARLRREKRERHKKMCNIWVWAEIFFFVFILGLLGLVVSYHQKLHAKNECGMTYIYRPMIFNPIPVQGNNVDKYTLLRYHEGYRDESVLDVDIPVLFVPGSSGSGKQVRSLATTIINSTAELGDKFKYRFVFYACDFDEEFSFLSGATLIRQREFVVKSIETILNTYSPTGVKKLLLMGHSFGGTILHSLPAHPRADPKWMDLVITLGAPINAPPFKSDFYMEAFYENTMKAWNNRKDELSHITLISYSGGIKDFMVPDHLARNPFKYTKEMGVIAGTRDSRVLYRPSWSLRDVATDVDHNCLAWCNQLIKHISGLSIRYGMEWKMPKGGVMKASRQVVKEFYVQKIGAENKVESRKDPQPLFNNSIYIQEEKRKVKFTEEYPYVKIDLDLRQYDMIAYIRARALTCSQGITARHADLTFRSSENFTTYSIQEGEWMYMRIFPVFPETERLKGILRIGGTPDCEYEIESHYEVIGTMYRRLMDSTSLPFFVFYVLFIFAMIPVISLNRVPPPFDYIYGDLPDYFYTGLFLTGAIGSALLTVTLRYEVERNFLTYWVWVGGTRLISVLICLPAQPVIRLISRRITRCGLQMRAVGRVVLTVISLSIASHNINLGYASFLFINLFKVGTHSKNGIAFIIFSISILMSIGLAGNVRDGPSGVFQRSISEGTANSYVQGVLNVFYEHPHPLLFSFVTLSFCSLLNFSHMLRAVDDSAKEKITGVFYCMLSVSVFRVTNLEAMAVVTTYYILLFESMKDYKGLKAGDGKNVD
ncbi:hypothetical protein PRIPAC_72480, partial [Pristionchus pacificus]|uniref:GPI inositol-deacylase n=1 Tax=Pristionchus pacificus TaxID=54126 RepID=A0A8R1Z6F6_PRIPA